MKRIACIGIILGILPACRIKAPETYTGDLPELRSRGILRVIVRPEPLSFLPRHAEPVSIDGDIGRGLAETLGLELKLVTATDYGQMIDMLVGGTGDVIAAGLSVTEVRENRILFSVPYRYVDELLVTADRDPMPTKLKDLNGRQIAVRQGSSYAETAADLQKQLPGLRVRELAGTMSTETMIEQVARGKYPATIADSNYWAAVGGFFENLKTPLILRGDRPIALGMRKGSVQLKQKADEYLYARALTRHQDKVFTDDLKGLKNRGRLRMITRNNAMTYFIHRGVQVGFEYEFMKHFADQQGLRLEIVIPPSHEEMIPFLNEGEGDVVAASMTITDVRRQRAAFTQPYMEAEEILVARAEDTTIQGVEDLAGRTVHVRASSSFYETLAAWRERIEDLSIVPVSEDIETEEILADVESGKYDITVCDSNLLQIEQSYGRRLKAVLTLKPSQQLGWAVRKENPELLAALNDFIKREYRGQFYNTLKKRYFEDRRYNSRARDVHRTDLSGSLSPYDETVRGYAKQYNLDWRLIIAQMYAESRFNPKVVSWAGAQGLMQVMPRTARELGIRDITEPEAGIHAGVKYLRHLLERFDPEIPMESRIRFALAAYNAGYGHVLDARRLAGKLGLDPDRWFANVEVAIRLLEKPQYYQNARYGYCRGRAPVHYVRRIQNLYEAYVEVLENS
jgi:membrane-bound lytic murein transglycosylase F